MKRALPRRRVASGAAVLTLCLGACGGGSSDPAASGGVARPVGAYRVTLTERGFSLARAPGDDGAPGAILLESHAGDAGADGAFAPLAVRAAQAAYEMSVGSWRITDGPEPWRASASLRAVASDDADGHAVDALWVDAAGLPLARLHVESPAPGVVVLRVLAEDPAVNRTALSFRCAADDHFLGFGAQADGLDHRGHRVPLWTSEPGIGKSDSDDPPQLWFLEGARHASSYGLPSWLSSRGFIGVLNEDRRSVFDLCSTREDAWRVEAWSGGLELRLYDGPAPADALERATGDLLGRPPRPPAMAFAPWLDAIFGSERVRAQVRRARDAGIPFSALWTEDFRGGHDVPGQGYRLKEEWDLDATLYPDAAALAAELRAGGIAWHAYFNTFLVEGTRVFAEATRDGHFVKNAEGGPYLFDGVTFVTTGLADLSRPETRTWVKSYLARALDAGFDGWMADYGEWLPHDARLASGEDALAAHARYPREWVKLNAELLAERAGDGRARTYFARAGWLGSTAYSPVVWAGDQRTSFQRDDGLPTVVPMGLGLGLGGVSTFGHDIAGYQSATNPPSTRELYFRWTTLGALTPVMRTHHGTHARENWWWGQDAETAAHFRRWARLHTALLPYLDGASVAAETRGLPLMRAMALAFPAWGAGWPLADQYLLGPSVLVAPVDAEGATSRTVELPPGRWLRWEVPPDGAGVPAEGAPGSALDAARAAPADGPATLTEPVPLGEAALFVAAGAIVPQLGDVPDTFLPAEPPVRDLDDVQMTRTLHVFLGGEGAFEERDGTRYALAALPGAACPDTGACGAPEPELPYFEAGAALRRCAAADARGCVAEHDAATRHARLRLAGAGPVDFALAGGEVAGGPARLTVTGPPRRIDVVVRW